MGTLRHFLLTSMGHLSSQELHQIFDGRPDLTHHLQVAKGQHLGF